MPKMGLHFMGQSCKISLHIFALKEHFPGIIRDYFLLDSTLSSMFSPLFPPCLTLPIRAHISAETKSMVGTTNRNHKGKGQEKHPCGTFYLRQNSAEHFTAFSATQEKHTAVCICKNIRGIHVLFSNELWLKHPRGLACLGMNEICFHTYGPHSRKVQQPLGTMPGCHCMPQAASEGTASSAVPAQSRVAVAQLEKNECKTMSWKTYKPQSATGSLWMARVFIATSLVQRF